MMTHTDLDLKLEAYQYDLPSELIAERPVPGRDGSRLLVFDEASDTITHANFTDLASFLDQSTTLVFNRTKVFPCRVMAKKTTGGVVEVFFLKQDSDDQHYPVLLKSSGKKPKGMELVMPDGSRAVIHESHSDGTFTLSYTANLAGLLSAYGKVPIPPYIRGGDSDDQDLLDYQTVYAKEVGSVAAPTAGLHFSDQVFDQLRAKGIGRAEVTLHVGMGTFAPVKVDNILDHKMHSESFCVSDKDIVTINNAKKRIAVGTTSLRAIESGWSGGQFSLAAKSWHSTNIFLHPGKSVESIQGILTNFHLPGSSLIMLVSALIGREKTLALYKEAVKERYRFFSYGDAMLILRKDFK
tara:strand:- start:1727 stop:2785 length:1059 start_codon:yes stop_codon:yes gene_type:complete